MRLSERSAIKHRQGTERKRKGSCGQGSGGVAFGIKQKGSEKRGKKKEKRDMDKV